MFRKLSSLALSVLVLVSASTVNATASDKESEQKLLSENEEVILFEDAGLLEEADHITEYRNSGYDVIYIKRPDEQVEVKRNDRKVKDIIP